MELGDKFPLFQRFPTEGAGGGGGGSQTPWLSDINGAGYYLYNPYAIAINSPKVDPNSYAHLYVLQDSNNDGIMIQSTQPAYGAGQLFVNDVSDAAVFRLDGSQKASSSRYFNLSSYTGGGFKILAGANSYVIVAPTAGPVGVTLCGIGKVPTYALDVNGDVNISGTYRVNGTPISGGGGSQTPWTSDIDGGTFKLYNVSEVDVIGNIVKLDSTGWPVLINHLGGANNGTYGFLWDNATEKLSWNTAGIARWYVSTAGHFLANTDNSFDIGQSAATRPRNIYAAGSITSAGNVTCGLGSAFIVSTRSKLLSLADGNFTLQNSAGGNFGLLQFGGTSASFPALRKTNATLDFVLADQSAYTTLNASGATFTGTRPALTFNQGTTAMVRLQQYNASHTIAIAGNASYDGANWQRDDTGAASMNIIFNSNTGKANFNYAAAGGNPITYATPFVFDMVNNCFYHVLPSAANDAAFLPANSMVYFYVNEAGNALTFRVKYSTGTVKGGTIALT